MSREINMPFDEIPTDELEIMAMELYEGREDWTWQEHQLYDDIVMELDYREYVENLK